MNKKDKENYALTFKMIQEETEINDVLLISLYIEILKDCKDSLQEINEKQCNESLSKTDTKRRTIKQAIVGLIAHYFKFEVEFSNNPFAYPFKLMTPNKKSNSWTGEGWGINW